MESRKGRKLGSRAGPVRAMLATLELVRVPSSLTDAATQLWSTAQFPSTWAFRAGPAIQQQLTDEFSPNSLHPCTSDERTLFRLVCVCQASLSCLLYCGTPGSALTVWKPCQQVPDFLDLLGFSWWWTLVTLLLSQIDISIVNLFTDMGMPRLLTLAHQPPHGMEMLSY